MRSRIRSTTLTVTAILLSFSLEGPLLSQALVAPSNRFKALAYTPSPLAGTWRIHERDGANRQVTPYLSSLGQGEAGMGVIVSPDFIVASEKITMTLCGHDGPEGRRKKNFVALVDAATGETLRQTHAPLSDALKPSSWLVADLKGRRVRFEAHDHDSQGAFAWLGVGEIDAGPALKIEFRAELPKTWQAPRTKVVVRTKLIHGGIPFRALAARHSMIPPGSSTEIRCGLEAKRLYFLGGTVASGRPLQVCGHVTIRYREAPPDRYPSMMGFTLDRDGKLLSKSRASYLHPSGDPFQPYFVIEPKAQVIESIQLEHRGPPETRPRITAITCEMTSAAPKAARQRLLPLPDCQLEAPEAAWIEEHAISANSPSLDAIKEQIRKDHKLVLEEGPRVLRFERQKISDRTFEAASAVDVNNDGKMDIVSGGYWYEGPEFRKDHKITDVAPAGEYWDDFSDFPMDVNGDGFTDIITGAFFGGPLRWLENPKGAATPWNVHPIEQVGAIETTRFWDVDGDGVEEICPNASGNVIFFRLVRDSRGKGTGKFTKHVVKMGGCGHGLGFGDVNGDGRGDFVVPDGWIEAPEDPLQSTWVWHDEGFRLGSASVPILVHDVNTDGKADLIVGEGHDYGLDWYEQGVGSMGRRTWTQHRVDRGSSQYHDMLLSDIDNDGKLELVTGKRYRAHNGNDPGSDDPVFIRYFDIEKGALTCHTLDYGPPERTSGVGIYCWVEDVDGNGWKDLVAPGKEGLYLFKNLGRR